MARKKPEPPEAEKPDSKLSFFPGWCKKCGNCVEFCPKGVWESDEWGYPHVARPEECTLCRLCEKLCPDFAITVGEKTPSAAATRPAALPPRRSPERVAPTPPKDEDDTNAQG
ncbi:MAG: ferredoxin family protein [Thermodesulfobacteriota bacterium]